MSQLHFSGDNIFQNISDYSVIDVINYGSFENCYKVKRKSVSKLYVWKAINYGEMSDHDKEELRADIKIIDASSIIYSNVIRYYGTIVHGGCGTLYAILEYCHHGDLESLINNLRNHQLINEKFAWKVVYQVSKAIEALHRTIPYLNIKPSSIFLDKYYNLKLTDSRLYNIFQKNIAFSDVFSHVHYLSPEQIRGMKNGKTDVWALGCLLLELCTQQPSFTANNINELKIKTSQSRLSILPALYSENLNKMVRLMINFDHNLRPSVETIAHHPTVICNYDGNAIPFHEIKSKSSSMRCGMHRNSSSIKHKHSQNYQIADKNERIQIAGRHERPQSTVSFDPKKITEDVYNEKFFNRLKLLSVKETALKIKEHSLKTKEFHLLTMESNLVQKQKLLEERKREMDVLLGIKETKPNPCEKVIFKTYNNYKKKIDKDVDLESTTCSADRGDTSIMPTATRLDPSKIIKPSCFIRNIQITNDDNRCQITQSCAEKHPTCNSSSDSSKRRKSCGTLKKYKQIMKKK